MNQLCTAADPDISIAREIQGTGGEFFVVSVGTNILNDVNFQCLYNTPSNLIQGVANYKRTRINKKMKINFFFRKLILIFCFFCKVI